MRSTTYVHTVIIGWHYETNPRNFFLRRQNLKLLRIMIYILGFRMLRLWLRRLQVIEVFFVQPRLWDKVLLKHISTLYSSWWFLCFENLVLWIIGMHLNVREVHCPVTFTSKTGVHGLVLSLSLCFEFCFIYAGCLGSTTLLRWYSWELFSTLLTTWDRHFYQCILVA